MRLISARLIISLIVGITLVSLAFSYYEVQVEKSNLRHDLERRAEVLGESLAGNVERPLEKGATKDLQRIVERFGNREHLLGIAVYDQSGNSLAVTPGLGHRLVNTPLALDQALIGNRTTGNFVYLGSESAHVYTLPLHRDTQVVGVLAIVHDASFIGAQSRHIWRQSFQRTVIQVFLIALITLLIVRWSLTGPISRAAQWMRALRTGGISGRHHTPPDCDFLRPLAHEVATFAESLNQAPLPPKTRPG